MLHNDAAGSGSRAAADRGSQDIGLADAASGDRAYDDVPIRARVHSAPANVSLSTLSAERLAQIRVDGPTPPAMLDRIRDMLLRNARLEDHRVLLDLRAAELNATTTERLDDVLSACVARPPCERMAVMIDRPSSWSPPESDAVHCFSDALAALRWLDHGSPEATSRGRRTERRAAGPTIDDQLECFNDIVRASFPADVPVEKLLISDDLLHRLHGCVRDCVAGLRDAGAERESVISLIHLSMAELRMTHPVHPAIAAAVREWAADAFDAA